MLQLARGQQGAQAVELGGRENDASLLPDLATLASRHNIFFSGDASGGTVQITNDDATDEFENLRAYLKELGFSSAVMERIFQTRALDGTQRADGWNCNVTWTYHPDDGLSLVFEAVANK